MPAMALTERGLLRERLAPFTQPKDYYQGIEYTSDTSSAVLLQSYKLTDEYEKTARSIRDQLKKRHKDIPEELEEMEQQAVTATFRDMVQLLLAPQFGLDAERYFIGYQRTKRLFRRIFYQGAEPLFYPFRRIELERDGEEKVIPDGLVMQKIGASAEIAGVFVFAFSERDRAKIIRQYEQFQGDKARGVYAADTAFMVVTPRDFMMRQMPENVLAYPLAIEREDIENFVRGEYEDFLQATHIEEAPIEQEESIASGHDEQIPDKEMLAPIVVEEEGGHNGSSRRPYVREERPIRGETDGRWEAPVRSRRNRWDSPRRKAEAYDDNEDW